MKKFQLQSLLTTILLAGLLISSNYVKAFSAPKGSLLAGTAKVLITPKTPLPMAGYAARKDLSKGVHDDLYARVIVFSDGINKAALIVAELSGFPTPLWEEITKNIAKETGIKQDYILLAAIHTHSGPVTRTSPDNPQPDVQAYLEELKGKLVAATKEAMKNLVPASIGAGKGECKMNTNRRAPNGKGGVDLGVNPYAPCDHEVGVIRVDDKSGNQLALLINWPCHAVVLGPKNYQITSDWPGAASKYVEEGIKGKLIAPIIIGASGDINPVYGPHIDFESNSSYSFGKDAIGEDLANEAMRVMKDIKTFAAGNISAMQRVISLPAKPREPGTTPRPGSEQGDSLKVRLSILKIGNIVLTGVSGEVFNQISVQMRNQSPYSNTFMITHCNGSSGYLVTENAYPKPGTKGGYEDKTAPTGGYEPTGTRAKTGAEKAIINNLLEMINEL